MNRLALGLGLFVLYGIDEDAGLFRVSVRAGEGDDAAELYSAETDDEATVDAMIAAVVAIRDEALHAAVIADAAASGPQAPVSIADGGLRSPARRVVPAMQLPGREELLPGKPRPVLRWRGWGAQLIYGEGGTLPPRTIVVAFQVLLATSENIGKPGSVFSRGEVTESGDRVTLDLFVQTTRETGGGFDPFVESFVEKMNRAIQSDLDAVGFGRQSYAVFVAPQASRIADDLSSERRVVGSDSARSGLYFISECRLGMAFRANGYDYLFSVPLMERMSLDKAIEFQGSFAIQTVEDYLTRNRTPSSIPQWVIPRSGAVAKEIPVLCTPEHKLMRVDIDTTARAVAPASSAPAPAVKAEPLYPDLFAEIGGKTPPEADLFVFVRQSGEALLVLKVSRSPADIIVANGSRKGDRYVSAFSTAYPPPYGDGAPVVHRAQDFSGDSLRAFLGDENERGYGALARRVATASSLTRGKLLPFAAREESSASFRRFVLWLVAPVDLPAGVELDEGVADFIRRSYKEEPSFKTIPIIRVHADGSQSVQSVDRLHARLADGSQWFGAPGSARTVGATILPLIAKELSRKGYPYALENLTRHKLIADAPSPEFILFNGVVGVRRDLLPAHAMEAALESADAAKTFSDDKGKPLDERAMGASIETMLKGFSGPIESACVVSLFVGKGKSSTVVLRVSHGTTEESFVAVDATLVAWAAAMAGGAQRLTAQVIRELKNKHVLLRYWRDDAQTDLVAIAYLVLQPFPVEFKADEASSCLSYQLSPLGVEKIKAEAKGVASSGLSIEIGDVANYDRRVLVNGGEPAFSTLKTEIAPFVRELMALSRASGDVKMKRGMDSPVLFISAGYSFAVLTSVVFSGSGHVGARRVIRVDRGTPGTVAVSLHAFAEMLGNDSAKALSFTTARSDAGSVFRMVGSRSGEIDAKPASVTDGELRDRYASKMEHVFSLEWDDAETIEAVSSTMSSDDTRPHLACVSIGAGHKAVDAAAKGKCFPAGRMYFHATDGHRMTLGWSSLKVSPPKRFDLCVSAHAVPLFLQVVEQGRVSGRSAEVLGLAVSMGLELEYGISRESDDDNWRPELWIVRNGEDFVWGQSGLQPPAWYQVIPDDASLVGSYEFSSWKEAVKAIDAADATYTEGSSINRGMRFTPGENGKATLKAVTGIEGSRTKKSPLVSEDGTLVLPELRSKGEAMVIEIQSSYLRDAIAAVGKGGRVSMRVSGELDPALFTSGRDGGRIAAVVMPRRMK